MKPSMIALFLLLAFIASSAEARFLLDAKGDMIVNGGQYYVLPYIWSIGGGVRLTKTENETCPLSVVTSPFEVDIGLPWTVRSPLKSRYIPTNANLDFFSVEEKVPNCVNSPSKWTIVKGEDGVQSVKLTGYDDTIKGWFRLQHFNKWAYKIEFCPTNRNSCGDIGLSSNRHLIITDEHSMGFVLVKAESSSQVSEQVIKKVLEA